MRIIHRNQYQVFVKGPQGTLHNWYYLFDEDADRLRRILDAQVSTWIVDRDLSDYHTRELTDIIDEIELATGLNIVEAP